MRACERPKTLLRVLRDALRCSNPLRHRAAAKGRARTGSDETVASNRAKSFDNRNDDE